MPGYLDKSGILSADTRPRLALEVPEWEGTVLIRRLGGLERLRLQFFIQSFGAESLDWVPRVVAEGLIDEDGARLFADDELGTIAELSPSAILRVANAVLAHNKFGDREVSTAQGEFEPSRSSDTP